MVSQHQRESLAPRKVRPLNLQKSLKLMSLWLPLLDFARSYGPLSRQVAARVDTQACVEVFGLNSAQVAAFLAGNGKVVLADLAGLDAVARAVLVHAQEVVVAGLHTAGILATAALHDDCAVAVALLRRSGLVIAASRFQAS